jgi:hypothetical protein
MSGLVFIEAAFSLRPSAPSSDPLSRILNHPVLWLLQQPLFWAVLGVLVGPFLFYRGFRLLRLKRLVLDTPRSKVRAAALGEVEVVGKASGPYTLVSPLRKTDCFYYRVVVRVHNGRTVIDEMCVPVFLDDGTGQVMIDPRGADLQFDGFSGDNSAYLNHVVARHGFSGQEVQWAKEYCIEPGSSLFVLGTLRENPWAGKAADTNASELTRIGPFVSEAEADLLRREAFEFLDPAVPSGATLAGGQEFDLYPPAILMKGPSPFVISNRSYREVVSKLHWKSVLYIWGGPLWALAGLWEILTHVKAWGWPAGISN